MGTGQQIKTRHTRTNTGEVQIPWLWSEFFKYAHENRSREGKLFVGQERKLDDGESCEIKVEAIQAKGDPDRTHEYYHYQHPHKELLDKSGSARTEEPKSEYEAEDIDCQWGRLG